MADPARHLTDADVEAIAEAVALRLRSSEAQTRATTATDARPKATASDLEEVAARLRRGTRRRKP